MHDPFRGAAPAGILKHTGADRGGQTGPASARSSDVPSILVEMAGAAGEFGVVKHVRKCGRDVSKYGALGCVNRARRTPEEPHRVRIGGAHRAIWSLRFDPNLRRADWALRMPRFRFIADVLGEAFIEGGGGGEHAELPRGFRADLHARSSVGWSRALPAGGFLEPCMPHGNRRRWRGGGRGGTL